jgi:hypothetical protein
LRCGLPADKILQKKPTRFAKNNPKRNNFVNAHRKFGSITAVKGTFKTGKKYSPQKYQTKESQHSRYHNYACYNLNNIQKIIKILIVKNKLKRNRLEKYLE